MKRKKLKVKSKNLKSTGSYRGLQEDIRKLKTPKIEVWGNKYRDKDYIIRIQTEEFSCICPKTGLPDYAKIRIEYTPDRHCIELKSFKLYLISYRNTGIFHEHIINKIFDDFLSSCKPRRANIEGEFSIRGGIKTTVTRQHPKTNT